MVPGLLFGTVKKFIIKYLVLKARNVEWFSTFQIKLQTNKKNIIIKQNANVEKLENI